MDETKNWLKTGAVVVVGLLAFLGYKYSPKERAQVQTNVEAPPSYQHSLKVGKKVLKTYRSPAAVARLSERPANRFDSSRLRSRVQDYSERNDGSYSVSSNAKGPLQSRPAADYGRDNGRRSDYGSDYNSDSNSKQAAKTSDGSSNGTSFAGGSLLPTTTSGADSGVPENNSDSSAPRPAEEPVPSLHGKVKPLVGLVSSFSSNPFIQSAYAANNCIDPRIMLFDLKDMSVLLDNPISDEIIRGEASFEFDPIALKLEIKTPSRYLLHTNGCETNYQRIVTSFFEAQDLDFITTLISKVINTEGSSFVDGATPESLTELYKNISNVAKDPTDPEAVYDAINGNSTIDHLFDKAFPGSSLNQLANSAPDLDEVKYFSKLKEKSTYLYKVSASHWDSNYQVAQEWQIDGVTISTDPQWSYVPVANSPTDQVITLVTGKKASNALTVDRSFPYHEVSWDVEIEDTYPAIGPVISLNSSVQNPTLTKAIQLDLSTGIDCETFSEFAITENDQTLNTAAFTNLCTVSPVQTMNYTLNQVNDGPVTLKFWSRDIVGRVSETPTTLSIVVDTTAPKMSFVNLPASFTADENHNIEWTLTEDHSTTTQNFSIELYNGSSWVSMGTQALTSGPHNGTSFIKALLFPNLNIIKSKLRITYADTLGQQTVLESPNFNILRPYLSSQPNIINMGLVPNKSLSSGTLFNFTNTGLAPSKLCGPVTLSGTHASEFVISSDGCNGNIISAGGTCPMTVAATPTQKGTREALATITCGNDTYTAKLLIESTNNAPITTPIAQTTLEDTPFYVDLGSLQDMDSDSLTYSFPSGPGNGTLSNCYVNAGNYFCQYSPDLNFNGADSFTYRTFDGLQFSNTSTVTLTVLPVNDAPTITGTLTLTTDEDTALNFDLTAGSDVDFDTLSYIITSGPSHGTLVCPIPTSLNCTYTPALNYNGPDSFTYRVTDGLLNSSGTITATITVNPINDAPVVATDQTLATRDNVNFNFTIDLANDIDTSLASLTYKLVSAPAVGTLSNCITTSAYTTDRTCSYIAPANQHGPVTFTYLVYDGEFDSSSVATITINVNDETPTVPNLSPANFSSTVSTPNPLLTLTAANCTDISYVFIQESTTAPTAGASGWQSCSTAAGALNFDPTITNAQGFRTLRIYGKDAHDNISGAQLVNFIYDTLAPIIVFENVPTLPNGISYPVKWRLTEASVSAASTFKIEYSLNNGSSWVVQTNMPVGQAGPHASTLFTYNWSVPAGTYPSSLLRITLTDNNAMTGTATSNVFRILVDINAPNMLAGGMTINGSTTPPPTPQKYVSVSLGAIDDDTNITHFCLKNGSAAPTASDGCWRAVDAPQPGLVASETLSLVNFPYLLGFVPGSFNVYAWIKDLSGNISTNTATVGKDMVSITYFGDYSPVLTNFIVSNTRTPPNPITANEMEFDDTDPVYIKWTASDDKGVTPTIKLAYTKDDVTFTEIASNLSNSLNNCSTLNEAGTTLDDGSTGCYEWVTPTELANQYFRVQLIVEDTAQQATSILSLPINSTRFKILAGNVDPGVNSHAKSAIIAVPGSPSLYSLAVASDGKVFVRDANYGLMYINPQTGIFEQLLTVTGTSTGDNGPVRSAGAKQIYKITMDYQDRLIIWDYDRIRRIDTKTEPMQIETIIGAYNNGVSGTQTTDTVTNPADLKVYPGPTDPTFLQPLPNGDIYFQSGPYGTVNDGNVLRIYRGSLPAPTIASIRVSGSGAYADYGTPTAFPMSLTSDTVSSYSLDFNSSTSVLNKIMVKLQEYPYGCSFYTLASVDLSTYASTGPHPPEHISTCGDWATRNGLDGKMYHINNNVAWPIQVSRYNAGTNSNVVILGAGQGFCADGTPATSCRTNLTDIFVTQQGKVFFLDNGLVRVIDDSGNVQTLYGQTKTYGNNGLAQDARFNSIYYIDHGVGDNVIIYDSAEKVIREVRPNDLTSQVVLLAGNGQSGTVDFNIAANAQTLNGASWDQPGSFVTNPVDGTVYFSCLRPSLCKLNRGTGKWELHSGGGTNTTLWTALGTVDGANTHYGGYTNSNLAFYNGRMVTGHYSWSGTTSQNSILRELDVTTKTSTFMAGKTELDGASGCSNGAGNNCNLAAARTLSRAFTYHTGLNGWLFEHFGNELKLLKTSGTTGSITLFDTLPDGVQSMVWNGNILYYCDDAGLLKKRDYSTSLETTLNFPGSGITCYGYKMLWKNASGDKPARLVFPFRQNGLSGVAEYLSP